MGGQKPVILTLYFFLCGFLFFLIVFIFVPISSYFFLMFPIFSYISFFLNFLDARILQFFMFPDFGSNISDFSLATCIFSYLYSI